MLTAGMVRFVSVVVRVRTRKQAWDLLRQCRGSQATALCFTVHAPGALRDMFVLQIRVMPPGALRRVTWPGHFRPGRRVASRPAATAGLRGPCGRASTPCWDPPAFVWKNLSRDTSGAPSSGRWPHPDRQAVRSAPAARRRVFFPTRHRTVGRRRTPTAAAISSVVALGSAATRVIAANQTRSGRRD